MKLTTHHTWVKINDVDKTLVASVGPTMIMARGLLTLMPLPLRGGAFNELKTVGRQKPRSEPAATGNTQLRTNALPRPGDELTSSSEDEQREERNDSPIIVPQHGRSPRTHKVGE